MSRRDRDKYARRATAYAAVIGATALITVIGLTALTAVRVAAKVTRDDTDFDKARFYARAAIEKGLYIVAHESNWRSSRAGGTWEQNVPIGDGTYTLEGQDPIDGILGNVLNHPIWLVGTGTTRSARYKLRVELESTGGGLTCLEVPLHASKTLTFTNATVTSNGPISSNMGVNASGSLITANIEAVSGITGGVIIGTQTTPINPRVLPDAAIFAFYADPARATAIPLSGLPKYSGTRAIQGVTLSATSNPYGTPNAGALYYIDCGGDPLVIRNSKITATLVVLNASQITLRDSMNWQKPSSGYPSLLVQGNLAIDISATSFLFGLDLLPSTVRGLFYASGQVTTSSNVSLVGVLAAGNTLGIGGTLTLTYDSSFLQNPPPGFGTPMTMQVIDGSWRQLID